MIQLNGVIDVGGGMRGIYGAGVLDRCIDEGIHFDICYGISAGSANISSFMSGQKGRNYRFYREYSFRKEYMSFSNLLKNGSYLGLDYIYSELSNNDGENPLDIDALQQYKGEFCIIATRADDAKPVYFTKKDIIQNNYFHLKASCSIPIACKPCNINGTDYFDGGLSDPIPIDKAVYDGCEKLVVILTKPINYNITDRTRLLHLAKKLLPDYPEIAKAVINANKLYIQNLKKAVELKQQNKAIIIAPDDCCGVSTLKKTPQSLENLYQKGYSDAEKIKNYII